MLQCYIDHGKLMSTAICNGYSLWQIWPIWQPSIKSIFSSPLQGKSVFDIWHFDITGHDKIPKRKFVGVRCPKVSIIAWMKEYNIAILADLRISIADVMPFVKSIMGLICDNKKKQTFQKAWCSLLVLQVLLLTTCRHFIIKKSIHIIIFFILPCTSNMLIV